MLVLGVDPSEGQEGLRTMKQLAGNPPGIAFALDTANRVTLAYGVRVLGTKIFIDSQGNIVERVERYVEPDALRDLTVRRFGLRV